MGNILHLNCKQCKYSFNGLLGEGRQGFLEDIEWKKRFERQGGPKEIQFIYNAINACVNDEERKEDIVPAFLRQDEKKKRINANPFPRIHLMSFPYRCNHCKKLINHKRVNIKCKRGVFIENDVKCPSCGNLASPINLDALMKNKDEEHKESGYISCPKCGGRLELTGVSFFD